MLRTAGNSLCGHGVPSSPPLSSLLLRRNHAQGYLDQARLLWLLNGDRLVMLAEEAATIETAAVARHTCRRKPTERGRVLAWELPG
jgi:hypothetical protein